MAFQVTSQVVYEAVDNVSDTVKQMSRNSQVSLKGMAGAAGVVVDVIKDVASKLFDAAKAAAEADLAHRRLWSAMSAGGKVTRDAFEAITAYNSAIESSIGIDGDRLAQLQGTLSLQGVAADQMRGATEATIGLAEVTGSLESAARLVARAYEGNFQALQRYLPQVKDGTTAQAEFARLFEVSKSNADNLIVRLSVLEREYENVIKAIGNHRLIQETTSSTVKVSSDILRVWNAEVDSGVGIIQASSNALKNFLDVSGLISVTVPGVTKSFEEQVGALDAIAVGADAAKQAIEALNKATGFLPFGDLEGDVVIGDPESFKRNAQRAAEERKKQVEELRQLGAQPTLEVGQQIAQDAANAERAALNTFFGPTPETIAQIAQDQVDAVKKANAKLAEEQKKADEKRIEQAKQTAEQVAQSSIGATQAVAQGVIAMAASFARASEIEQEAYDKVHGIHEEMTEDEKILADASKQASEIRSQAMKQLASTVITQAGQIIAAVVAQQVATAASSTSQVLAIGAATAANEGAKVSQEVLWPASMAVIPAVIGAITAIFASLVTAFADGGVVKGGTPGKDSVPAMLMPGERVLNVEQNRAFEHAMGAAVHRGPGFANGGVVGRNGPMQSITLVLPQYVPERDASFRRTIRQTMVPTLSQLSRDGSSVRDPRSFGPRG